MMIHPLLLASSALLVLQPTPQAHGFNTAAPLVHRRNSVLWNEKDEHRQVDGTSEGETVVDKSTLLSSVMDDILQLEDALSQREEREPGEDNDDVRSVISWKQERARWKSQRYLMLKDISTLIESGSPEAVIRAHAMVDKFLSMDWTQYGDTKPLLQAYNLWLNAIAKTCVTNDRGQQAEQVVKEMKEHGIAPTVISFTIAMNCHAKDAQPDSAQQAERLLFTLMEQQQYSANAITSITTDAVLNAWAQQGTREAAERAQLLLERMQSFDETLLSGQSYTVVMNAFSKIGAAQETEDLLEQYRRNNSNDVDIVTYNVVLNAWARSNDARAGTKASALLEQIEESPNVEPDVITYNSIISAWSKSNHVNAAAQAERVLQRMMSSPDGPKPNTITYNSVLHAWAKSTNPKAPSRASIILEYMIRSENNSIRPDIYSFTSVLNVFAKSKTDPQKASKARALLDQLLSLYRTTTDASIRPTNIAFNTVLNACAFSASFDKEYQREALRVAVSTYALLRNSNVSFCQPDEVTYGNMLKVIGNLMNRGPQRTKLAMTVIRHCIEDGLVGEMVWEQVPKCISKEALLKLLPDALHYQHIQLVDLPRSWRQNIRKRPTRRRKRSRNNSSHREPVNRARPIIQGPRGISQALWSGKEM